MSKDALLQNAMAAFGDTVFRLALCRTQEKSDAEDVYQDVFLKLMDEQDAESWSVEHLKAWLIRCTINRCEDLHRSFWRRKTVPLDEISDDAYGVSPVQSDLWEAVGRLRAEFRIPVHLFYAEGYSTDEIAIMLNIPSATVRSRLFRARKQLRKDLED